MHFCGIKGIVKFLETLGQEVILKKHWLVHRLALNGLRLSGFLFECEWAGEEVVIGPMKFILGCYWVQIQWANSNFHTHHGMVFGIM